MRRQYENFILLGDFNNELTEPAIKYFCLIYNYKKYYS